MSELIRFECPQCGKSLSAKPQFVGRSTRCPKCQCLVQVPAPAVETEDFFSFPQEAEPFDTPDTPDTPVPKRHSPSVPNAGFEDPHPDVSPPPHSAIPPVRPSIPPPRKYPPIPAHYTPDSFRRLADWFERLVFYPFFATFVSILLLAVLDVGARNVLVAFFFLLVLFLAALAGIAVIVLQFILLYRCWWMIQDGAARTTPEKALWLLGIPLFNFYWWYVVIVGLAEDMNRYCDERGIKVPRISVGHALAVSVVYLWCVVVPIVNVIAALAMPFLLIRLFKQYANVSIAILETRRGRAVV